jgi:hypothetical protein
MKSIKTNPNFAKGPDIGEIVNKIKKKDVMPSYSIFQHVSII